MKLKLFVAFIVGTLIGFTAHSATYGLGNLKNEWLPVASALLGAAIGGCITIILQYIDFARQKGKEHQTLLLKKLEELHETIPKVKLACTTYNGSYMAHLVMLKAQEKIDVTYADKVADEAKVLMGHLAKIESLQRLYFPEGNEASAKIESALRQYLTQMPKRIEEYDEQKMSVLFNAVVSSPNELRNSLEGKIHSLLADE